MSEPLKVPIGELVLGRAVPLQTNPPAMVRLDLIRQAEDGSGIPGLGIMMLELLELSRQILAKLEELAAAQAVVAPTGAEPELPTPPPALACPSCGAEELEHQGTIGPQGTVTYYCRLGHVFEGPAPSEEES